MLELRSVHYRAGAAHILKGVSLEFRANEFNVILGPNGAGKSTLLKLATGLLRPSEGDVYYETRRPHEIGVAALARRRAVLSQHVELAFPLPVDEVVMMGRYPHFARVPSRRDREIVGHALDLVDMADMRRRSYPTLSGGEQQKVQLARVIAQIWADGSEDDDTYLFLDEPTSNLDVHYELHLLDVARGLLNRRCTVVAILHDLNLAFRYGSAFFLLEGGRLAATSWHAEEIDAPLIERVFRVRAHRVADSTTGRWIWQFESAA
jgi:iron complex transport system ATP-binding protein